VEHPPGYAAQLLIAAVPKLTDFPIVKAVPKYTEEIRVLEPPFSVPDPQENTGFWYRKGIAARRPQPAAAVIYYRKKPHISPSFNTNKSGNR
jgi:hypothetical protein